jgi:hypothetical protein
MDGTEENDKKALFAESGTGVETVEETPPSSSGRRAGVIALVAVVAILIAILAVALAPKGKPVGGVLPADPKGYSAPANVLASSGRDS